MKPDEILSKLWEMVDSAKLSNESYDALLCDIQSGCYKRLCRRREVEEL